MMQKHFITLLRTGTVLLSAACLSIQAAEPLNGCDLNSDGAVNSADVSLAIGMSTGAITPCTANIIGNGICNVVMVQRVINNSRGTASCGRTVTLSWTASVSAGVTGYKVYRSTVNGGPYALVSLTPVTGTVFVDSSIVGGLTYYYVITAVNATNESAYSTQATAVVPNP